MHIGGNHEPRQPRRLENARPASAPYSGANAVFRISRRGHDPIVDVDQAEQIEPVIRAAKPDRYHVNEISRDPLPSGHTARPWGVGIKRPNGQVVIEPDPWGE
jgi:hypothetical protein